LLIMLLLLLLLLLLYGDVDDVHHPDGL
jgi:hypothetical protein